MSIEVLPAAFIRLDLFPANVKRVNGDEEQMFFTVRIIVTDAFVYTFSDSPNGPTPTYRGTLLTTSGDNKIGYTVTTDEGDTLTFKRSSGCGCGSRLRGYRPFPGVPVEARSF